MDSAAVQALVEGINDIELIQYSQLSSACLMLYDHATTFDEEYSLFWRKSNRTVASYLFFYLRYFGAFVAIWDVILFFHNSQSNKSCSVGYIVQGYAAHSINWAILLVLSGRVWALYGRSRKIFAVLGFMFMAEFLAYSTSFAIFAADYPFLAQPILNFTVCSPGQKYPFSWIFWPFLLTAELTLLCLALYVGIIPLLRNKARWDVQTIAEIVIRDNVLYFAMSFCVYLINLIMWFTLPDTYIEVGQGFSTTFSVILGSRLMLNLRKTYENPFASRVEQCADEFDTESFVAAPNPELLAEKLEEILENPIICSEGSNGTSLSCYPSYNMSYSGSLMQGSRRESFMDAEEYDIEAAERERSTIELSLAI